jgi:predicted AAA+ superfamily ATPase
MGKRLVRAPKNYLSDTQMVCHLLDLDLEEVSHTKPELFGHLLENFVATELIKQLSFSKTRAELYHFRTSDNKEIDFILEKPDGSIFAIEVKRSELVTADDFRHIRLLQEAVTHDFTGGIVLYMGKDIVPFGKDLWAVPLFSLWA